MSSAAPPSPTRTSRFDPLAVAILFLALALRLYRIDAPFVDAHSWRQVTNADIARLWAEGPIDFFYPSVSWGGPDGRVGLEFPLLQWLIALAWRLVGISNAAARLVTVAFSLVTVWLTYRLGARLFGTPAGRAAAFLMAVSPSLVYFGRAPLSDTPMLTFSVAAVLGYVAYAQTGRRSFALLGAVSLALAGLVKVPAVLVFGPVIWVGILSRGRHVWRDPWYVAAPLGALGAIALWYLHADQIYLETGLTQAVFRPSGTYPPEIAQWAGPFTTVSHWTRPELLTWDAAGELAFRYWALHLTPAFAVCTAAGVLTRRWPLATRSVVDVWMLAAASLVMVSLAGQLPHEFHQLPTLPPLALYFGMMAGPLFGAVFYERVPARWSGAARVAAGATLTALALLGFLMSGVVRHLYRPDNMNLAVIDAGWAIDHVIPADAPLATIEYERYGSNSPILLYFAHRQGWSFDATSISPSILIYLREHRGVCHLAVPDWPTVEAVRPDIVDFLRPFPRIDLPYTSSRYQLIELGCADAGA